jgi:hypothetical protein
MDEGGGIKKLMGKRKDPAAPCQVFMNVTYLLIR